MLTARTLISAGIATFASVLVYTVYHRDSDYLARPMELGISFELSRYTIVVYASALSVISLVVVYFTWLHKAIGIRKTGGKSVVSISAPSNDSLSLTRARSDSSATSTTFDPPDDDIKTALDSVESFWGSSEAGKQEKIPPSHYFMASSKFLSSLSQKDFEQLYQHVDWKVLKEGAVLFRQGDRDDPSMYIVVSGRLGVAVAPDGEEDVGEDLLFVSEFIRGDSFGEYSLILNEPRFFTCVTRSQCQVIKITKAAFDAFRKDRPAIMINFIKTTLTRHWKTASDVLYRFLRLRDPSKGDDNIVDLLNFFKAEDAFLQEASSLYKVKQLQAGEILCSSGASASSVFVVLKGTIYLDFDSQGRDSGLSSTTCGVGSVLGVAAFLTGTAFSFNAQAISSAEVAVVSSSDVSENPVEGISQLSMATAARLFPSIRLFYTLGFQREWKPAGTFVYRKKDPADEVYIVQSGRVRAVKEGENGKLERRFEIGLGECVGELAFLAGDTYHSHHTICLRDTELVKISAEAFAVLQERYPAAVHRFTENMARRFRKVLNSESTRNSVASRRTFALVPLAQDVDIASFAKKLTVALKKLGSCQVLTQQIVDDALGIQGDNSLEYHHRARLSAWLTEQEEEHDVLLFVADPGNHTWMKCCLRAADSILLIANAESDPTVSDYENDVVWESNTKHARLFLTQKELVLLHPDDCRLPSGTQDWLSRRRKLNGHHHLRVSSSKHYDRLARCLSNRAIGLVLSGGGARGLAHLGVLKALEHNNLAVDFIGGTSQGSFMAAIIAIYETYKEVIGPARVQAQKMGNIFDLLTDATVPIISYFSGERLNDQLQTLVGKDTCIEDLWIGYFCVTTNISKADVMTHSSGILWRAVRASMSILDYLPPMFEDGSLLIDGGYINNLPADVMRNLYAPKHVIGCDVENKEEDLIFSQVTNYGDYLSGSWLMKVKLLNILNPFASSRVKIPRFSELVSALTYVNNNRNTRLFMQQKIMDVYIRPELGETKLLDYHKIDALASIGYNASDGKIKEWLDEQRHAESSNKPNRSFQFLRTGKSPRSTRRASRVRSNNIIQLDTVEEMKASS